MSTLTIASSYFALPNGSVTISDVDLNKLTVAEVKAKLFGMYGNSVCSISLQNLWWNGYVLEDGLTIASACVGTDLSETIDPSEDLTLFLTINDRKAWVSAVGVRMWGGR